MLVRIALSVAAALVASPAAAGPLDPAGKIHVPIGIANTLDTLKTFVEAEGCFSPGFGSYGVYFWIYDQSAGELYAPPAGKCAQGLPEGGYLIPWSQWTAGKLVVRTEVCEVKRNSSQGDVFVVASRAVLRNPTRKPRKVYLYVALRPLGPAGFAIRKLSVSGGDALFVDDRPALVADSKPASAGVLSDDAIGEFAMRGTMPRGRTAASKDGNCSGALRFDIEVLPDAEQTVKLICPVLPGRRAVGHDWDGTSDWAQFDLARPNPDSGGVLQGDPGIDFYRGLKADVLFDEATRYWQRLVGRARIKVPDARWGDCFAAITGHAALEMNEGAPDVAVVNYNVFNRDGVYVANILQKSGNFALAADAIDYFLAHPFNGRGRVEADNPGQILWVMGQHWLYSRDRRWLRRVYPSAAKIASMIRYYRTAPPPHYVKATSLEFGDALPPDRPAERPARRRQVLRPGSCDGHHPEYTEAFDVAGLLAAAMLAGELDKREEQSRWKKLADTLMRSYKERFGGRLPNGYGSYSVLWPCRLYPLGQGEGYEQFKHVGAQKLGGWRYFALARSHQGLLAGSRPAGHGTIDEHLSHEQMRGWYLLDEGGRSGSGGWGHVRTTWNGSVAMPHGWAVAELHLLLRDCLLLENEDRLHLLAGVPPGWFEHRQGMAVENLPTYFGACSFVYKPSDGGATLTFTGKASPPAGFLIALPPSLKARVTVDRREISRSSNGNCLLPPGTRNVRFDFIE